MPPAYDFKIPLDMLPFHQQDTGTFCGAACAQMVLHSLLLHYPLWEKKPIWDQNQLRNHIENRAKAMEVGITWYSPPDGLANTLNAFPPPPPGGSFQLFVAASEPEISRKIVWSLHKHKVPVLALVYGMMHWVLVRGFATDRPPLGPDDTGYNILAFYLADPWPPLPRDLQYDEGFSHADAADGCGSGTQRGLALNKVSYDEWRSTGGYFDTGIMTGVPADCPSAWRGRFLAICDPAPTDDTDGDDEDDDKDDRRNAEYGNQTSQSPAGKEPHQIIDAKSAVAAARAAVSTLALDADKEWQPALAGAQPAAPAFVQHLGAPAQDMLRGSYYLVPFVAGTNATLAVRVDASTGRSLQALATPDPARDAVRFLDVQQARQRIIDAGSFSITGEGVEVTDSNLSTDARLVWKPCLESFSPTHPFYEFTVTYNGTTYPIYVAAQTGTVYTRLTDNVAGA